MVASYQQFGGCSINHLYQLFLFNGTLPNDGQSRNKWTLLRHIQLRAFNVTVKRPLYRETMENQTLLRPFAMTGAFISTWASRALFPLMNPLVLYVCGIPIWTNQRDCFD